MIEARREAAVHPTKLHGVGGYPKQRTPARSPLAGASTRSLPLSHDVEMHEVEKGDRAHHQHSNPKGTPATTPQFLTRKKDQVQEQEEKEKVRYALAQEGIGGRAQTEPKRPSEKNAQEEAYAEGYGAERSDLLLDNQPSDYWHPT